MQGAGRAFVVWAAVFVTLPVYDNRRSLHAIGDAQITLVAIGFATLILAGLAYFFYRELSRVLFVYFALIDALLLLAWRASLRLMLRVRHAAWPGSKRRVLIVGTGPLADEVAARLRAYTWTGLELAGFLSNTPDRDVLGPLSAAAAIVTRERIDEVLHPSTIPNIIANHARDVKASAQTAVGLLQRIDDKLAHRFLKQAMGYVLKVDDLQGRSNSTTQIIPRLKEWTASTPHSPRLGKTKPEDLPTKNTKRSSTRNRGFYTDGNAPVAAMGGTRTYFTQNAVAPFV